MVNRAAASPSCCGSWHGHSSIAASCRSGEAGPDVSSRVQYSRIDRTGEVTFVRPVASIGDEARGGRRRWEATDRGSVATPILMAVRASTRGCHVVAAELVLCTEAAPLHRATDPRSQMKVHLVSDLSATTTVYTIGHSNHREAQFLALLRQHAIELLVDVRSAPYSRFAPHFNRDNLRLLLREAGIQYAFAGEKLGGRPNDPTCYLHGVIPEPGANYRKEVDYVAVEQRSWYQEGIERLLELATRQRVVVMCSEENPDDCHRHHLIARTLLNRGISVLHIRQYGETEPAAIDRQQISFLTTALRNDST